MKLEKVRICNRSGPADPTGKTAAAAPMMGAADSVCARYEIHTAPVRRIPVLYDIVGRFLHRPIPYRY